jgi:hypothetical protein
MQREARIDRLAAHVRASVDLAAFIGNPYAPKREGAASESVNPSPFVRTNSGTR